MDEPAAFRQTITRLYQRFNALQRGEKRCFGVTMSQCVTLEFLQQEGPKAVRQLAGGLGLMGWLGIPLDMSTMLIGGITIGLAVDDTIHFMHRFGRYCAGTGDPHRAVRETLETTGTAMLFTSVVLCAGFLIFTLAYMTNIATFGLLSSFATATAFLADVTMGPALMILVTRGRADARLALSRRRPVDMVPAVKGRLDSCSEESPS